MDQRVKQMTEADRLRDLLIECGVSDVRREALEPVIQNVGWMRNKLDEAREAIKGSSVAIPYDNGGGQKGIRENPLFKGYSSLWKTYLSGMSLILDSLPPEVAQEQIPKEDEPKTVLALVRDKYKKEA